MPAAVLLLACLFCVYQFFFRYEHWIDSDHGKTVVMERDNLTGALLTLQPGQRIDPIARLFGGIMGKRHDDESENTAVSARATADDTEPPRVEDPMTLNMVEDKQSAPVPGGGNSATGLQDLNTDGMYEKVVADVNHQAGVKDISVLSGIQEVFYGQGTDLKVLPSKHKGWSDLMLVGKNREKLVYRFNESQNTYELYENN